MAHRRAGTRGSAAARRDGGHFGHQGRGWRRNSASRSPTWSTAFQAGPDRIRFGARRRRQRASARCCSRWRATCALILNQARRPPAQPMRHAGCNGAGAQEAHREGNALGQLRGRFANTPRLNALYLRSCEGPSASKHLFPLRLPDPGQGDQRLRVATGARLIDEPAAGRLSRRASAKVPASSPSSPAAEEDDLLGLQERCARSTTRCLAGASTITACACWFPDKTGCYAALGVLHELYKPIPGKFQGLTSPFPRQMATSLCTRRCSGLSARRSRCRSAPRHAPGRGKRGVAAHWPCTRPTASSTWPEAQKETSRWLQEPARDPIGVGRFQGIPRAHQRATCSPTKSTCSHPRARSLALPRGAHRRRFRVRRLHTDIGHHCVAARINYELLPLRTELKNGDHVEILTSPTARPNPSWLSFRLDREGPLAHPPLPEGPAAEGSLPRWASDCSIRRWPRSRSNPIDHLGPLGGDRPGIRNQDPHRNPGRHRPGQAPFVRRRAGTDQVVGQV